MLIPMNPSCLDLPELLTYLLDSRGPSAPLEFPPLCFVWKYLQSSQLLSFVFHLSEITILLSPDVQCFANSVFASYVLSVFRLFQIGG